MPEVMTPDTVKAPGICISTQVGSQPNNYAPIMTGKMYAYVMVQLESQVFLHLDEHMFSQEELYQDEPAVVVAIMDQISFKAGLKEWGDQAHSVAKNKIKQPKFRNTFITMHLRDLTYE